jgi:hypothetical protein
MLERSGLSDVHSTTSDIRTTELGEDAALVTLMIDQRYVVEGRHETIRAPTSIVLRRQHGAWLVVLIHTVPLAEG